MRIVEITAAAYLPGGNIRVYKEEMRYKSFEWSVHASSHIQWAAFHINSSYMFEEVTSGHQAILAYGLYLVTQPIITTPLSWATIDATKHPLYEEFINRFRVQHFMPNGKPEA
jgi:hypothetical protein